MNDGLVGLLRLVSVAIQNAGFAVVVGALLGRHWLAHGASAWQRGIGRRLVATLRIASVSYRWSRASPRSGRTAR